MTLQRFPGHWGIGSPACRLQGGGGLRAEGPSRPACRRAPGPGPQGAPAWAARQPSQAHVCHVLRTPAEQAGPRPGPDALRPHGRTGGRRGSSVVSASTAVAAPACGALTRAREARDPCPTPPGRQTGLGNKHVSRTPGTEATQVSGGRGPSVAHGGHRSGRPSAPSHESWTG